MTYVLLLDVGVGGRASGEAGLVLHGIGVELELVLHEGNRGLIQVRMTERLWLADTFSSIGL